VGSRDQAPTDGTERFGCWELQPKDQATFSIWLCNSCRSVVSQAAQRVGKAARLRLVVRLVRPLALVQQMRVEDSRSSMISSEAEVTEVDGRGLKHSETDPAHGRPCLENGLQHLPIVEHGYDELSAIFLRSMSCVFG
jgi:hypothetical protein